MKISIVNRRAIRKNIRGAFMNESIGFILPPATLPTISDADMAHIRPPYVHFKRQSEEYILYVIRSGELYLTEGNTEYTLKENDVLLLDPSQVHFGRKSSKCQFYYVHFHWSKALATYSLDTPGSAVSNACIFPKFYHLASHEQIARILPLLKRLVESFRSRNDYAKTIASSILVQLLFEISWDFSKGVALSESLVPFKVQATLNDLKSYLEQNYESEITGDMLSDLYHYHFDYLNREYKKWTGETIFSCLKRIRIERAKQLLSTGYYSVEEVARKTGYKDTSYFSKVFSAATGVTPGRWG